ncbi:MAG: hypothetical protein ACYCYE_06405 [Clostridia bacterium]
MKGEIVNRQRLVELLIKIEIGSTMNFVVNGRFVQPSLTTQENN